ncbi:MAG: glycosyltransferase family 2 protein [Deltaproteobacteria bacterium]|jgi:dolichol-phosphate mannosyltransferase|nr:glycosyltransferase family 2 protein [Deltaproteobacteria bacterium]
MIIQNSSGASPELRGGSARLTPRKLSRLSIVIPVYNEEESLPLLRSALEEWLEGQRGFDCEVVLVDDGSDDGSFAFCAAWAEACPWVKFLSFSRNFGHQAAVTAGLRHAAGCAAVVMDADLQDPLEVIPEMIRRYEEGYDIAYGQRIARKGESVPKKVTAWLFYRLMRRCVHKDLPVDAGDFRLISRPCLDAINSMPEAHRFLRGMFAWTGFRQVPVPYVRNGREAGESKYPLHKMVSFAWNAITSFSNFPIRGVAFLGFCTGLCGFMMCIYALWQHAAGNTVPGWSSLIGVISLIGGMILISIAIIGEYIGKIYEEAKNRPLYIIRHAVNTGLTARHSPAGEQDPL